VYAHSLPPCRTLSLVAALSYCEFAAAAARDESARVAGGRDRTAVADALLAAASHPAHLRTGSASTAPAACTILAS